MEEWKVIPGYEDYEVSSLGRIKRGERILKHGINRGGYEHIKLSIDGIIHHKRVHTLVATTFIPNPENEKEIDHKDGNKRNNSVQNLEWSNRNKNKTNPNTPQPLGISNERFIRKRHNDTYMVRVYRQNFSYCKHFKTLPEAIIARNEILTILTSLRQ